MDANEAMEQLKKAINLAATAAQEQETRGADPDALALGTIGIMDGMSEETKLAHLNAVADGLSSEALVNHTKRAADKLNTEERAAVLEDYLKDLSPEDIEQLLARLDSKQQTSNNTTSPPPPTN